MCSNFDQQEGIAIGYYFLELTTKSIEFILKMPSAKVTVHLVDNSESTLRKER